MNSRFRSAVCLAMSLVGLSACGSVVSESSSTIEVDGRTYELRTQVLETQGRTYEHSSVVVKNRLYTCLPESPNDCAATVRSARTSSSSDR